MSQELSSKFLCPICYRFASLKFKGILRHIGSVHSNDANFNVVCGVTSCPRTFKTFHAYKKHLYRSHRDECGLDFCKSNDSQLDDSTASLIDENTEIEDCHTGDSTGTEITKPPQLQSALLIMKLKQKYKLSQVALNAVTDEVTDLVQSKLISLEQKLHNVLGGVLTNEQLDIMKQQDLTNPFGGLRNAYQQEAYFTTYLDYQVSIIINTVCLTIYYMLLYN